MWGAAATHLAGRRPDRLLAAPKTRHARNITRARHRRQREGSGAGAARGLGYDRGRWRIVSPDESDPDVCARGGRTGPVTLAAALSIWGVGDRRSDVAR